MKVVVLHPPLYPVNHKFFNELGKYVELVVFSFGNQPGLHSQWKAENYINPNNTYKLIIIDGKTNLKRKAVSYRIQLNPSFLFKIRKEKPDVVISIAFWFPSLYMAYFKSILKSKFIVLTDAIKQTESNISKPRKLIRKLIANRTDVFIACSDLTFSFLKEEFPQKRIEKSFQTIDVFEWKKDVSELENQDVLKRNLGFSKDKITLLSIGNFIPLKNLEKLIDEVLLMSNCELVLIGEGELKPYFEEKIKINNASDKVKLIPHQNEAELRKYYKASDVFVFPTNRDTFGYVVVEALASGIPVVCSRNSGASSIINDGENGFVVNPQDDFTKAINKTISNLSLMKENASNSTNVLTLNNRAKVFFKIIETAVNDL